MYFSSRLCCLMCWIFPDGVFCNLLLSKNHLSYQYIPSECRQQKFWLKLWLHDNVNLILQNLTLDEKHMSFFFLWHKVLIYLILLIQVCLENIGMWTSGFTADQPCLCLCCLLPYWHHLLFPQSVQIQY